MNESVPLLVYIASASQDEDLRKVLEKHLAVLVKQNRIRIWHRKLIPLGANAQKVQEEYFTNAAIILLLMSANFLDECSMEMDLAASRSTSAIVIPILLRAVDLQDTPFEQLQCLPRDGSPIEECRSRNKAFQEIVREIREVTLSQSSLQKKHVGEKERKLKAMIADHHGFIVDRLGSFVGRQNELIEIQQRIEEKMKTGGYVTITGQAGQGKSSIIAKLVEHYGIDIMTFHFIPLNPGPDHQVGLLRNLMAHLIIKYDLSDLYVASESRAALREYFPKVLVEIAEKGGREIIFVDGLDQLKDDDNGERDLSFLPDSPPIGFVFVIGTRPNDTLRPLKLLKPHNEYQLPNLSRKDFALILKRHQVHLDNNLTDQFYTTMQENALYLDLVAKELAESMGDGDGIITPVDMIKRIAHDPNSIFSLAMMRFKRHPYQWRRVIKPILGVLLAALEPLSIRHIRQILDLEDDELREGLERLGGLITKDGQQRCSLFHLKLHDYLREDEKHPTREYIFAADEEQSWHKKLAQWCKQKDIMTIWQDIKSSPTEQTRREYARWYYVTHLYQAKEWPELFAILDSEAYGQAKMRFDPSIRSYVQELNLGRRAAAFGEETIEYGLQFLPQLWKYTFLQCSLTSRVDRYPVEAFKALLALQREAEVVGLAEFLTKPDYKAQVLLLIAQHLKTQPHREQEAFQFLMRSLEIARSLVENKRTEILVEISYELAGLHRWERAEEVVHFIETKERHNFALKRFILELVQEQEWEYAKNIAANIEEKEEHISILRDLFAASVEMQQWERAEEIVRSIEPLSERNDLLSELGIELAKTQQWDHAETVIRAIGNQKLRMNALSGLSFELIEAHQWDLAEKVAYSIHILDERLVVLDDLASALIRNQQWTRAEAVAQTIEKKEERDKVFRILVSALIETQRWEHARTVVSLISEIEQHAEILETIALALIKAQQWDQAEEIASSMKDLERQTHLMSELALSLAHKQLWERAEKVALAIQKPVMKVHVLYILVTEFSQGREWRRAEALWVQAEALAGYGVKEEQVRALCKLGIALARARVVKRREKIWALAKTLAYDLDNQKGRAKVSFLFLASLVKAQEWDQVKIVRREIENNWQKSDLEERARALCELWIGLTELKREEEANEVWEELRNIADNDYELQNNILCKMGVASNRVQEFGRANEIWKEIINNVDYYDYIIDDLYEMLAALLEIKDWKMSTNIFYIIISVSEMYSQVDFLESMDRISTIVKDIKFKNDKNETLQFVSFIDYTEKMLNIAYTKRQIFSKWERDEQNAQNLQDDAERAISLSRAYSAMVENIDTGEDINRNIEIYSDVIEIINDLAEDIDNRYVEIRASIIEIINSIYNQEKRIATLRQVILEISEDELEEELWEELITFVSDIEDEQERAWIFIELGVIFTKEEEWERAEILLSEAKTVTDDVEDREERIKLLYTLVALSIKLGKQEYAGNMWQEAEEATRAIQPFTERVGALITLGMVLYNEQGQEQAKIIWEEVDTKAHIMHEEKRSAQIMIDLCIALTQAHDWDWVKGLWGYVKVILISAKNNWPRASDLEEIEDAIELDQALIVLSTTLIKHLQWDLVGEMAHFISNPQEQAKILQQLGLAMCKTQQWDKMEALWNETGNVSVLFEEGEERAQMFNDFYFDWASQTKVIVLIEKGLQLYKAQQCEMAKKIWSEVEALILTERDDWLKAELLRNLGIALAQCQQWQWAETVAYAISAAWAKTEVFIELSIQFHMAHYEESAEKLWGEVKKNISMIKEYPMRVKELQRLGTMFLMIGEEKRAEEIWNKVETAIYMIPEGLMQDEALDNFTYTLAQGQQWERAQKIAYRIEINEYRARALIALGIFLDQAKHWKRAEFVWTEAKKQAHAIQDYSKRVTILIKLSTALVQTGHLEQAKSICNEIIMLAQKDIEYKNKIGILSDMFDLLLITNLHEKILYAMQNEFIKIHTREKAIELLPLAFKLVRFKPEIGVSFYKSFSWVDSLSQG